MAPAATESWCLAFVVPPHSCNSDLNFQVLSPKSSPPGSPDPHHDSESDDIDDDDEDDDDDDDDGPTVAKRSRVEPQVVEDLAVAGTSASAARSSPRKGRKPTWPDFWNKKPAFTVRCF